MVAVGCYAVGETSASNRRGLVRARSPGLLRERIAREDDTGQTKAGRPTAVQPLQRHTADFRHCNKIAAGPSRLRKDRRLEEHHESIACKSHAAKARTGSDLLPMEITTANY